MGKVRQMLPVQKEYSSCFSTCNGSYTGEKDVYERCHLDGKEEEPFHGV